MTSEVALLNRSAVALAADSAATVRRWERDHYENYYFKGANKIFQLSAFHPVGIMTYATASLQGAPWDVLIKSYRDQLGNKPHDQLSGYAGDLFDYITNNAHIFSPDIQEKQFKSDVDIVAAGIVRRIRDSADYKNAQDRAAKTTVAAQLLQQLRADIDGASFVGNLTQADMDSAQAKYPAVIKDMLEQDQYYDALKGVLEFSDLALAAICGQFKAKYTNLSNTGLVIAGFGDKDYFPKILSYRCYGLVLGKLVVNEEASKHRAMSQKDGSAFMSFAQDEMIQTFLFGMSGGILAELEGSFTDTIDNFYKSLQTSGLAADITSDPAKEAELAKIKGDIKKAYGDKIIDYSYREHTLPMRSVLGSLPFDELAELAHTLVLLESLKERITSASASVSGPIDVAVISKSDGFVWIKRKHYFDPKLNPRYFANRNLPGGVS